MASRARSRRRFKSSTSRLTLQRYDIGGHTLSRPPSTTSLPAGCLGRDRLASQASGSWVATGSTAGRSTYKLSRCSHVVLYGGLGRRFLDHRAAAAAPHGLGGSEDQTSR